jgi:hypothetical protein
MLQPVFSSGFRSLWQQKLLPTKARQVYASIRQTYGLSHNVNDRRSGCDLSIILPVGIDMPYSRSSGNGKDGNAAVPIKRSGMG